MATQAQRDAEFVRKTARLFWPRRSNVANTERVRAGRAVHYAGLALAIFAWAYWGGSSSTHDHDILFWLVAVGLIGGRVARYILADE